MLDESAGEDTPPPPPRPIATTSSPALTDRTVVASAPPAATPDAQRVMPNAESGPGLTDTFGIGQAVSRLSNGSRNAGKGAFLVLTRTLFDDEVVEVVVQCRYRGADGAMALTNKRLLIVNAREWNPDVTPVALEPGLTVQGWQDERSAALVFERGGAELVVDKISDREVVQDLVGRVRARIEA